MLAYDARFEVRPRKGLLDLRGETSMMQVCSEILQCQFPTQANSRIVLPDENILICLSNDHWIFETSDGRQGKFLKRLEQASSALFHSFIDVSDMYARILLWGTEAREVLAQCVEIDIHPSSFSPGSTARCAFADTTAQLTCIDSRPAFELLVFSSFERYACDWLAMAIGT